MFAFQLWPVHVRLQPDRCRANEAWATARHRREMYSRTARPSKCSLLSFHQAYTFHAYGRTEGVAGIIISDPDYPALVAHQLLSKVIDEFLAQYPRTAFANSSPTLSFPQLGEYIVKYQDPQQADSIMKIQKELDETKIVLHKTIESVLERGEKIDSLVEKSDGLSAQSKMFYKQVRLRSSIWKSMANISNHIIGKEAEFMLCHNVVNFLGW